MFESHQKSTGTRYTATISLLICAFGCCPAVSLLLRPWSAFSVFLPLACSALCVALAKLTIPSLAVQRVGAN